MFICKKCAIDKPMEDYRIRKNGYRIGKCRECESAYQRELSQRNPEEFRKRKRESMARKRAENPEAARTYHRERHYKNHDENKAKMRAYAAKRFFWNREMHIKGMNRATARQLSSLWKMQKGLCALTGRKLNRSNAHLDHIIPIARGGSHEIYNLRWLCNEANLAKRAPSDVEFIALCSECMAWIGKRIQLVSNI